MSKEFKLDMVRPFVGATIAEVGYAPDADEGFSFVFDDGRKLSFRFSGYEGEVIVGDVSGEVYDE